MTDRHRQELLRLVLAYEDLDETERRRADELLARDDDLRRQLQRIQAIELAATEPLPLDEEAFWTDTPLGPEAETAERESHARLREILDLFRETPAPALEEVAAELPWWREWRWRSAALLVPAAAVLVFLLIQLPHDAQKSLLRDLTVDAVAMVSDPSRTGTVHPAGPGVLSSGQAVALSFHLEQDAYVVVYHIDPAGAVQLVFPPVPDVAPQRLSGGTGHVIPDPDSGESWILGTRTGQETFLVGVNSDRRPDTAELVLSVSRPTADESDRERILADLMAVLSARMAQVQRIDLQHID